MSLPVPSLRFLRRGYGSVCRHLFFHALTNGATRRRRKALQNALLVLGTVLLFLFISLSENPAETAADDDDDDTRLRRAQEARSSPNHDDDGDDDDGRKELCLLNLRGLPSVVRSADVEVGFVRNGTLHSRVSPAEGRELTAGVTFADVARKRRELTAGVTFADVARKRRELTAGVTFADVARKRRRELEEQNHSPPRTRKGQGALLRSSPEVPECVKRTRHGQGALRASSPEEVPQPAKLPGRASSRHGRANSRSAESLHGHRGANNGPSSVVQSGVQNERQRDHAPSGQANPTGARQHSHEEKVQGSDSASGINSNFTEVDGEGFKTAKNGSGDSGVTNKEVENRTFVSEHGRRNSINVAKSYKRSLKSKWWDPGQTRNVRGDANQEPNPKLRSPKDGFITRASRKRVFDDVIVTSRSWEPIAEDDRNLFVYSAFHDDRPTRGMDFGTRRVRVLAMSVLHELRDFPHLRRQVFCHYRWRSSPRLHVSQRGKIMSIWEDHNKT